MKWLYGSLCLSHACLMALPTGHEVVKGDVRVVSADATLDVYAQGKAVISWDRFDIQAGEQVRFSQAQKGQAVLNRVRGGEASQILGQLDANCPIYLINPQGVFLGASAQIRTAGFLASTADVDDETLHVGLLGEGAIVNLGSIEAIEGDILLIARQIDNQGHLHAEGHVTLITTEAVLSPGSNDQVFLRISNPDQLMTGSSYAQAISHSGTISAMRRVEEAGRVRLIAPSGCCVVGGAVTAAGGAVSVEASQIRVEPSAEISVCTDQGSGGTISLVAKDSLEFYGFANARGANGGDIHFSSHGSGFQIAEDRPIVDTRPLHEGGSMGTFILDPKFVTIIDTGTDPATGNAFATDPSATVSISGAALGMAIDAANVVIQANTDIDFQDLVVASTLGNGLTLQAGRSISLSGSLTLNGGAFSASINDAGAIVGERDAGLAVFAMGGGELLTTGGDVTIDVGNFGGVYEGEISLQGSLIDAGGGDVSVTGWGRQDVSNNAFGVYVGGGMQLHTSGAGQILLNGTGGNGENLNVGVYLGSDQMGLQVENGQIHLIGQGGGNGLGNGNAGVFIGGMLTSTGTGEILVNGTGGNGVHFNMGMILSGAQLTTGDGNISLNGQGAGTGAMNFGVRFETGAQCVSTGTGEIALMGISGNGKNNNHGVIISGGILSAKDGLINIQGQGQGSMNFNYGIRLETEAFCQSTGTALITLTGHNLTGDAYNAGVSISCQGVAITSEHGDIQVTGTSDATGILNEGIRIESGQVLSTGAGVGSANVNLVGVSGTGSENCNGVDVQGDSSEVSAIDGNIVVEGTARGLSGMPILVYPPEQVNTTGMGTVTYIEH